MFSLQPTAAELQEQAAIGAGDTCLLPSLGQEASDEKPSKQIGDQLAPLESKAAADEDSKAGDDKLMISKLREEVKVGAALYKCLK